MKIKKTLLSRVLTPFRGILFLVAVLVLVIWKTQPPRPPRANSEVLMIDPSGLIDVKDVWMTDALQVPFKIRLRTGSGPPDGLLVSFQSSCPCAKVIPSSIKIRDDRSTSVTASVDLQSAFLAATPGVFRFTLLPRIPGGVQAPSPILITGRALDPIRIEPKAIALGPIVANQKIMATMRFVTSESGLSIRVAEPPRHFSVSLSAPAPNSLTQATLLLDPATLPLGPLTDAVRFSIESPTGQSPTLRVPVFGNIVPDVYASPSGVLLGICRRGEQIVRRFSLDSRTGEDFRIANVDCSVSWVTVSTTRPGNDDPAASFDFEVRGIPKEAQNVDGTITATILTERDDSYSVQVPLWGTVTDK